MLSSPCQAAMGRTSPGDNRQTAHASPHAPSQDAPGQDCLATPGQAAPCLPSPRLDCLDVLSRALPIRATTAKPRLAVPSRASAHPTPAALPRCPRWPTDSRAAGPRDAEPSVLPKTSHALAAPPYHDEPVPAEPILGCHAGTRPGEPRPATR